MAFTTEFYIALGIGFIGLLIIAYMVYSFLKSPKNAWQKKPKKPIKKVLK